MMEELKCISCQIPMGKTPILHHSNSLEASFSIFCFNCADLRERGIE